MRDVSKLPSSIPEPQDDGQTDHLKEIELPDISLISTSGKSISLKSYFKEKGVLFIYPRAGSPIEPNQNTELWDTIPGARGCTPQSCSFRDMIQNFIDLGINVAGLSIQSPKIQREFIETNHINYPILSDECLKFAKALDLPTFKFEGEVLIKRMSFYIENNIIKKTFYPVFPPDQNAKIVLNWLEDQK